MNRYLKNEYGIKKRKKKKKEEKEGRKRKRKNTLLRIGSSTLTIFAAAVTRFVASSLFL